jgi:hypothetical protein
VADENRSGNCCSCEVFRVPARRRIVSGRYGASSPMRRVVAHRPQGADSGHSPGNGRTGRFDAKQPPSDVRRAETSWVKR